MAAVALVVVGVVVLAAVVVCSHIQFSPMLATGSRLGVVLNTRLLLYWFGVGVSERRFRSLRCIFRHAEACWRNAAAHVLNKASQRGFLLPLKAVLLTREL